MTESTFALDIRITIDRTEAGVPESIPVTPIVLAALRCHMGCIEAHWHERGGLPANGLHVVREGVSATWQAHYDVPRPMVEGDL